jgi:hypothetical protein
MADLETLDVSSGDIISEGTLLPLDLITAMLSVVGNHDKALRCWKLAWPVIPSDEEEIQQYVADLFDLLNEMCPEGIWFGSCEGDGACFGFWSYLEDNDFDTEWEPPISVIKLCE